MWRGEEKLLFLRAEKLEKTLREKGKSPLPADKVHHSIKPMWQNEEKIVFFLSTKIGKTAHRWRKMAVASVQSMAQY